MSPRVRPSNGEPTGICRVWMPGRSRCSSLSCATSCGAPSRLASAPASSEVSGSSARHASGSSDLDTISSILPSRWVMTPIRRPLRSAKSLRTPIPGRGVTSTFMLYTVVERVPIPFARWVQYRGTGRREARRPARPAAALGQRTGGDERWNGVCTVGRGAQRHLHGATRELLAMVAPPAKARAPTYSASPCAPSTGSWSHLGGRLRHGLVGRMTPSSWQDSTSLVGRIAAAWLAECDCVRCRGGARRCGRSGREGARVTPALPSKCRGIRWRA